MSLIADIRKGIMPEAVRTAAAREGVAEDRLAELLLDGRAVVPANALHSMTLPCAIGYGLLTKVNANIGNSEVHADLKSDLAKLQAALDAGADTVMDLSSAGDIRGIRQAVIARSPVPVGTVPMYEAAVRAREELGSVAALTSDLLFEVVENHARDGADFMTLHCGVTTRVIETVRSRPRVTGIVSRGGALLAGWILANEKENPLYAEYDRLLDLCLRYEVTISLGDGLRPGCLADAGDESQFAELDVLGELTLRAREAGVQVMVEGPGHVPFNKIEEQVREAKRRTHGAPLYVLGPLVTDVAAGHDHVAGAIGGTLAAYCGADFLCYLTPREHLGLPDVDDVREGVIVSRIAAHAADIARGLPGADKWDLEMSRARRALDWNRQLELAMDSPLARKLHEKASSGDPQGACSMCGELCAIKVLAEYLGETPEGVCT